MQSMPRCSIETEGGDLVQVFDISAEETNGAKVEHTFNTAGTGISFSNVEIKLTFKVKLSTKKSERNYRKAIRRKEIKQLTLKYPDGTRDVIDGAYSQRSVQSALEGATELTLEFVGVPANKDAEG